MINAVKEYNVPHLNSKSRHLKKPFLPDKTPDNKTIASYCSNCSEHHDNSDGNMVGRRNLSKTVPIGVQK